MIFGSHAGAASQFVTFACVGAVATAVQYIILIGLVQVAESSPTLASDIGMIVGAVVSYALNRRFTFSSRERHVSAIPKFAIVAVAGLLINTLFVASLIVLQAHYLIAQVVATTIVLGWNFLLNRNWTFRIRTGAEHRGGGNSAHVQRTN